MPARGRTPAPAVSARGLTRRYGGREAVADLDLDVPRGSIFGFIGPSGSGKTTTIRLLTGIEAPTAGDVLVLDRPPAEFTPRDRARLGYLPQLSVLFPTLSLEENLSFVASIYGLPLRRRARVRAALDLVELWDDRHTLLRNASGGMQRRVALAAALVHEPDLLFLDEPTAGVDPLLRRRFWERFDELRAQGRTLFVTTQYVGEAAYCDLVGVLHEGRLVALDTPDALRRTAFGGDLVQARARAPLAPATVAELRDEPLVRRCRVAGEGDVLDLVVARGDEALPRLSAWFRERDVPLAALHPVLPPFDDVFVALLEQSDDS